MQNNMETNKRFTYQYSARQNREVERIRSKYLPKEESKIDTLRALDRRVQSAGMIQGLSIGVLGCLIFGIGMCFGLGVFPGANWLAILFGILGVLVMLPAYPIYQRIAKKAKEQLTPEILRLSDEIMRTKK